MGYNDGSPGESLQNKKANDRTLRIGVAEKKKREYKKKKRSVIKSENEIGKYGPWKSKIRKRS